MVNAGLAESRSAGIILWHREEPGVADGSKVGKQRFRDHFAAARLGRFSWFRQKQQLHFIHHRYGNCNFAGSISSGIGCSAPIALSNLEDALWHPLRHRDLVNRNLTLRRRASSTA
jgi:hypothetical protein